MADTFQMANVSKSAGPAGILGAVQTAFGFESAIVFVSALGVGTLRAETSFDGTTWFPVTAFSLDGAIVALSFPVVGVYLVNIPGNFFRLNASAYTSGTFTAGAVFYRTRISDPGLVVVSSFHAISAASNNATSVKAGPARLLGYDIFNSAAAARYVKFYDKATAPAPATDTALLKLVVGINTLFRAQKEAINPLQFTTGIAIAAVTGIADNDNTAVALSDLNINFKYV